MSKTCNVCGCPCEDNSTYCPTCGSPLSESVPVEQPQIQQVQPQSQQAQPQVQQAQPQFQQAQPQFQQEPPKKKSHKTLFIILGIVGGLIIILIILVIILVLFLSNHLITGKVPGTSSGASSSYERYETDSHEYYFPDYEGADHNSESYISNPTEATTEVTTEVASIAPEESVASITEADLRILGQVTGETDGEILTEPIPMSIDYSYTLTSSSTCSMTPFAASDSPTELNAESRYIQLSTGRDIVIGASANDFISKYGIDTTNAIWIMRNGETTDAYYYSTVSMPDFTAEQTQLVIGWYQTNDTWIRLSPSELNDVLCNYTYPDCSSIILYKATVNSDFIIDAIQIDYGSIGAMPKLDS